MKRDLPVYEKTKGGDLVDDCCPLGPGDEHKWIAAGNGLANWQGSKVSWMHGKRTM